MHVYEEAAKEQNEYLMMERECEAEEMSVMLMEDEYVEALIDATIIGQFEALREEESQIAEKQCLKGVAAIEMIESYEEAHNDADERMDLQGARVLQAHDTMIHDVMVQNGLRYHDERSLTAPHLSPLPQDMDDVVSMREYAYGSMCPIEDLPGENEEEFEEFADDEEKEEHIQWRKDLTLTLTLTLTLIGGAHTVEEGKS